MALRRGRRGEARHAISALHAIPRVKHVFVVDDDVSVDDIVDATMLKRAATLADVKAFYRRWLREVTTP